MQCRTVSIIHRLFGLRKDQHAAYYKDLVLGLLIIVATIFVLGRVAAGRLWSVEFVLGVAVIACAFIAASNRVGIFAGVLGFAALRFAFTFAVTLRPVALFLALTFALAGLPRRTAR